MLKPFPQSFWIQESLLCAGHYPGDIDDAVHLTKLNGLLDCGIRRVINLMEEGEVNSGGRPFRPYDSTLAELAVLRGMPAPDCLRMPLRDAKAPSIAQMESLLCLVNEGIKNQIPTYIHCWGGHGRTGTAVCCYLINQGKTAQEAIEQLLAWRAGLPRKHFPLENEQQSFIKQW